MNLRQQLDAQLNENSLVKEVRYYSQYILERETFVNFVYICSKSTLKQIKCVTKWKNNDELNRD